VNWSDPAIFRLARASFDAHDVWIERAVVDVTAVVNSVRVMADDSRICF